MHRFKFLVVLGVLCAVVFVTMLPSIFGSQASLNDPNLWLDMDVFVDHSDRSRSVLDVSGSGFDGVVFGATYTSDGCAGSGAFSFDGVDDFIDLGDVDELDANLNDFSITACIRTTVVDSEQDFILSKANNGSSDCRFNMGLWHGRAHLQFDPGPLVILGDGTRQIADGVWHRLVGTYDRDGDMVLYVDGEEVDRASIRVGQHLDCNTNFRVFIGSYTLAGGGIGFYFQGDIADVRMYERALTPEEAVQLSN